jgi:hypothetical protein
MPDELRPHDESLTDVPLTDTDLDAVVGGSAACPVADHGSATKPHRKTESGRV